MMCLFKNIKILFLYTLLFTLNSSVVHADMPAKNVKEMVKPFTAEYSVLHKSEPVGKGIRQLKYTEDGQAIYSYETKIEWLIFSDERSESSVIEFENNKVIPTNYSFERTGTGKDKSYEWIYDVQAGTAKNAKKKQTRNIKFPENIQDKLSYHFQHRLKMIENPRQDHYVYPVISTSGKIKNYVYQYDGEEQLMLPYGLINTIRLKREVIDKKRVTYAWFAPELNYLLVKLYQIKGDVEQFEAQLTGLTIHE